MSSVNGSIKTASEKITVELEGRDRIEVDNGRVRFRGCSELTALMKALRAEHGEDLQAWPLPEGPSHSEILVRELVLKLRGEWSFPYKEAEVCHCRNVSCKTIDQAVVAGAHSTTIVSRQTSASTACGTCRPDVQRMINYRLEGGLKTDALKKTA
jgi:bacterioferritin-associated ferredoxin